MKRASRGSRSPETCALKTARGNVYDEAGAKATVLRVRKTGRGSDHFLVEAYRCGVCGFWHIGKSPKALRRIKKRAGQ